MMSFHQELLWKSPSHGFYSPRWLGGFHGYGDKGIYETAKDLMVNVLPSRTHFEHGEHHGHHHRHPSHEHHHRGELRDDLTQTIWKNPLSMFSKKLVGDTECLEGFDSKHDMLHRMKEEGGKHISKKISKITKMTAASKILTGVAIGGTAQGVYSIMNNWELYKNRDYSTFAREVLQDSAIGCAIGGGLACVHVISPALGAAVTVGFLLMPTFNAWFYDGICTYSFWKNCGMAVVGLTVGSLMFPFGAITAGASAGLASYIWKWMITTRSYCPQMQQQKISSTPVCTSTAAASF